MRATRLSSFRNSFSHVLLPHAADNQKRQRSHTKQHPNTGVHVPVASRETLGRLTAADASYNLCDKYSDHPAAEKTRDDTDAPYTNPALQFVLIRTRVCH
jgi:hypothetical protein